MVDVVDRVVRLEVEGVVRIREDELHDLVLMLGADRITAVGTGGIAWVSPRLAWDDLKVVAVHAERIVVTGYLADREIHVDPTSGAVRDDSPGKADPSW